MLFFDKSKTDYKVVLIGRPLYLGAAITFILDKYKEGKQVTIIFSDEYVSSGEMRYLDIVNGIRIKASNLLHEVHTANEILVTNDSIQCAKLKSVLQVKANKEKTSKLECRDNYLNLCVDGTVVHLPSKESVCSKNYNSLEQLEAASKKTGRLVYRKAYCIASEADLENLLKEANEIGFSKYFTVYKNANGYYYFNKDVSDLKHLFLNEQKSLKDGGEIYIQVSESDSDSILTAMFTYQIHKYTGWIKQ